MRQRLGHMYVPRAFRNGALMEAQMKYVVIMTDGERVQLMGFVEHPIIFRSYEAAIEAAYDEWLQFPYIDEQPMLYECVKYRA